MAQDAAIDDIAQITPVSPVAGGNDPNASDDTLYLLEEQSEDQSTIAENEKGIVKQNGDAPGQKRATGHRSHFFLNPSARIAAKTALSKTVSLEVFATGGSGELRENVLPFGTRATNFSGGLTSNVDFGLVNAVFAYEHRQAYANTFQTWKSSGDKLGATVNKTLPFFIPRLTITPQLIAAGEFVDPYRQSAANVEATAGLTYTARDDLSFAASIGGSAVFLYGMPGYRHDGGLKLSFGTTYKVTPDLSLTLGASTNRTIIYGLPTYRADGSLSPSVAARYAIASYLTVSCTANYGRFLSTATGNSTFKYNINPSISLTIPL